MSVIQVILKTISSPVFKPGDKVNLLKIIGQYAGVCTDRSINSEACALRCAKQGHWSVFEHVSVTWEVLGVSRACSHQLAHHHMASYIQQSQRYTVVGPQTYWFVRPPGIKDKARYVRMMHTIEVLYEELIGIGVKPEDAQYILPNATKTDIIVSMNLREFIHFYKEHGINPHTQWEIRKLASNMYNSLISVHPELLPVFTMIESEKND